MGTDLPKNRLDAAVDKLEEQLQDRIEQPMRRLREAIEYRRKAGPLSVDLEELVIVELENIRQRDRLEAKALHLTAAIQIDHLAARLLSDPPPKDRRRK